MSTWNMPPGVTTNDIPGNESDGELQREYTDQFTGIEGIVDGILDNSGLDAAERRRIQMPLLNALTRLLPSYLSELQLAEWCAALNGEEGGFEEFAEEQQR